MLVLTALLGITPRLLRLQKVVLCVIVGCTWIVVASVTAIQHARLVLMDITVTATLVLYYAQLVLKASSAKVVW